MALILSEAFSLMLSLSLWLFCIHSFCISFFLHFSLPLLSSSASATLDVPPPQFFFVFFFLFPLPAAQPVETSQQICMYKYVYRYALQLLCASPVLLKDSPTAADFAGARVLVSCVREIEVPLRDLRPYCRENVLSHCTSTIGRDRCVI